MDLSHPARSVAPTLDVPVLACLALQDRAWTTREVADATGSTVPGARQVLTRLIHVGLVEESRLGRIGGYRLNRDHVMSEPLIEIAGAQGILRRRIIERVATWAVPAALVAVFGSWARGVAGHDSDVDLLVLHDELENVAADDAWEAQVDDLRSAIRRWSGNSCDLLSFTTADWHEHVRRADPVTRGVAESYVVLHGHRSLLALRPATAAVTE